ncbi:MAG: FTR1 family iron permease [Leptodesmis sp.]|uniref:FTR1 family iron permease n=1 Tax=Leptodesmis sp. TaxID=3100501 RepID=UPI003D12BF84
MINFTPALPTFVITLREGVEAALVVGIVLAYLSRAGQSRLNSWVYGGIAAGLGASTLVGMVFVLVFQTVGAANQTYAPVIKPLLQSLFSVVAIALLSWMLIWMTQQSRQLKGELEGAISTTLKSDSRAGWGIFGLIFFAVLREGFETVVFIAAKFQQGWIPILGAIAGILVAVGIGLLLFELGVKINLRLFFQVMGLFLLLIVAGLVVSALAHLDTALTNLTQIHPSASICWTNPSAPNAACLLGPLLLDTHRVLPERQFPGIVLHTLFGYEDQLYLVEAIAYVSFLAIVGSLYLRSLTGWKVTSTSKLHNAG